MPTESKQPGGPTIADWVATYRRRLHLSYRECEARSGVPFGTWSSIENRRIVRPSLPVTAALARGFGLPGLVGAVVGGYADDPPGVSPLAQGWMLSKFLSGRAAPTEFLNEVAQEWLRDIVSGQSDHWLSVPLAWSKHGWHESYPLSPEEWEHLLSAGRTPPSWSAPWGDRGLVDLPGVVWWALTDCAGGSPVDAAALVFVFGRVPQELAQSVDEFELWKQWQTACADVVQSAVGERLDVERLRQRMTDAALDSHSLKPLPAAPAVRSSAAEDGGPKPASPAAAEGDDDPLWHELSRLWSALSPAQREAVVSLVRTMGRTD